MLEEKLFVHSSCFLIGIFIMQNSRSSNILQITCSLLPLSIISISSSLIIAICAPPSTNINHHKYDSDLQKTFSTVHFTSPKNLPPFILPSIFILLSISILNGGDLGSPGIPFLIPIIAL